MGAVMPTLTPTTVMIRPIIIIEAEKGARTGP
jgi:hypothetical protein